MGNQVLVTKLWIVLIERCLLIVMTAEVLHREMEDAVMVVVRIEVVAVEHPHEVEDIAVVEEVVVIEEEEEENGEEEEE